MPLRLPRQLQHVDLRELEHDEDRGAQRRHRGQQHENRQQRRPVDDDQDHEHGRERHDQQQPVDTGERLGDVSAEPGWPGHGDVESVDVGDHLAQLFDRGRRGFTATRRVDECDELRGLAVVARDRWRHLVDVLQLARLLREIFDCRQLRIRQFSVGCGDHDRGNAVVAEKLGQAILHLRRFSARRQELRLVVDDHFGELAEGRAADADGREPPDEQHCGNQDAQPQGCPNNGCFILFIRTLNGAA